MRIAFAGSRDLGNEILKWLIASRSQFTFDLVGAVAPNYDTWWEDEIRSTCEHNGLLVYHDLEKLIYEQKPDILFSINYWKIIPKELINAVPKGIVNLHHSYLLRFRGRFSTSWALFKARVDDYWWHGTTLHYIDEELDNGKIIASKKCLIYETDTAESLFLRVEDLAFGMFQEAFPRILGNSVIFIEPSEKFYSYSKESKDSSRRIENGDSFLDVFDKCRAWSFRNRPGAYYISESGVKYNVLIERVGDEDR